MGGRVPKQFMLLDGVPILQRTIERFLLAAPDIRVITVLPRRHFETWKNLCLKYGLNCPQQLVEGGLTRFHSVKGALEKVPDGAVVAVHDGVRPLVSPQTIRDMFGAVETVPALIPGIPVTDTLRSIREGIPHPDRSALVSVQTPQMFHSEVLKAAYKLPYDTAFTDDASVVERAGFPVKIHPGDKYNIKITTPEDMTLASALLKVFQ